MGIRVTVSAAAPVLCLHKMLLAVDLESMLQFSPGRRGLHGVSGPMKLWPAWPHPLRHFLFS
jgi:hypothetical protein